MRKTIAALSLAGAASASLAQSPTLTNGVELYGIVDVGIESIDNGSATSNRITSGISTGSRWGLRGRENLGSGYTALFTLESRLEADTGQVSNVGPIYFCGAPAVCPGVGLVTPLPAAVAPAIAGGVNAVNAALLNAVSTVNGVGSLFDRQAYVGMITPFGAVLLGRQYTPGYEVFVKFNSFADALAGNPGHLAAINIRTNNAIQYRAELAGFIASVMYSMGGSEGNRSERTTAPTRGDDFYGLNLQYNAASFSVAGSYQRNNTVTYAVPTESRKGLTTWTLGATATFGPAKLFASYLNAQNENPVLRPVDIQNLVISTGGNLGAIQSTLGSLYINRFDIDGLRGVAGPIDLDVYHLGAVIELGNGTLHAAYNRAKDSARSPWATADARVDAFGLAYFYNLSKRSALYAAAAYANNKDQSRVALGAACCVGGWTTATGEDSRVIQIGMRHIF